MNDIVSNKKNIWNTRLQECIKEKGYTQTSFANALNKKFNTKYVQRDVSHWTHVGFATNEATDSKRGFPKYETMVYIADLLQVDLGYLTGEIELESFSLGSASNYMGLEPNAIVSIREVLQPDNHKSHLYDDPRRSLSRFISTNQFSRFVDSLVDLDNTSAVGIDDYKKRFLDLDRAIDFQRDTEYANKVARYELSEVLTSIMTELYLRPTYSNIEIENDNH